MTASAIRKIRTSVLNKFTFLFITLATIGCATTPENKNQAPVVDTDAKVTNQSPKITKPQLTQCLTPKVEVTEDNKDSKIVIGEIENFRLVKEKREFEARVDTGATTTSLGAYNIVEFERDGKKWVRFTLNKAEPSPKTNPTYKYPIVRIAEIKTHSDKPARRPVIRTRLEIGGKNYPAEVSLNDRSHMTFQLLIGRELLRDRFSVDVSHKHMMKRK